MAAGTGEEKSESPESNASASSGGGSKLVLILTGINVVVTAAMVAILFLSFQRDNKQPKIEDIAAHSGGSSAGGEKAGKEGEKGGEPGRKKASEFGKMVTLEQFTVNLATPGSMNPKFVRVNISLEVPTDDAETEVNLKMPQVRNVVIDLFNSKRPADLATAEGRDYLKDEIRTAINTFLVTGKVKGVFFTNFALSS
ncbi:MAG TPA: flagellar basal body-associated FliL family protein [Bdellovibrionota bacterium]|nr:flagellar basal body-associated FliL family protein [Bdellovibrionota bacterium]